MKSCVKGSYSEVLVCTVTAKCDEMGELMIKVSVIVPVYNSEKYLRRCMDALVSQTLQEIEIIAVNDGSTDQSKAILEDYRKQYPEKVKVIEKANGGQATARNRGLEVACGAYIGFADSDDYVDVTMYEKMYELAIEKQADFVECLFYYLQEIGDEVMKLKPRGRVREYSGRNDMFLDPQVSPWNKLYRREVLCDNGIRFPEGLIYEDTAFYLKSINGIQKSAFLDEPLVYYFLHGESTMNRNKSRKVADIFKVLQDVLDFYQQQGTYETYHAEIEYFCSKILLCSNLSRIGRVTDSSLKKQLIRQTFEMLRRQFPAYRKNPYVTGKIGLYMKIMNPVLAGPVSVILGKVMKG